MLLSGGDQGLLRSNSICVDHSQRISFLKRSCVIGIEKEISYDNILKNMGSGIYDVRREGGVSTMNLRSSLEGEE